MLTCLHRNIIERIAKPIPSNLKNLVQVLPCNYRIPHKVVSRRHVQVTIGENPSVVLRCLSHVYVYCFLI